MSCFFSIGKYLILKILVTCNQAISQVTRNYGTLDSILIENQSTFYSS